MSLGVALALTAEQTDALLALGDDERREEWLRELEAEVADREWFQYDKAWDELHRCLGDGELVIQDGPPLARAVFGSQPLIQRADSPTFAGYCRLPRYQASPRACARSTAARCASASTRLAAPTTPPTADLWTTSSSNMSGYAWRVFAGSTSTSSNGGRQWSSASTAQASRVPGAPGVGVGALAPLSG